jgi:hypothetical protein
MDEQQHANGSKGTIDNLAEKIAKATILGSRLLSQKAESISDQLTSLLVRRIILFTFFTVSTFFAVFYAVHFGLQYALLLTFPLMRPEAAAFLSAIGVLMLSFLILSIMYFRINSLKISDKQKE